MFSLHLYLWNATCVWNRNNIHKYKSNNKKKLGFTSHAHISPYVFNFILLFAIFTLHHFCYTKYDELKKFFNSNELECVWLFEHIFRWTININTKKEKKIDEISSDESNEPLNNNNMQHIFCLPSTICSEI